MTQDKHISKKYKNKIFGKAELDLYATSLEHFSLTKFQNL